MNSNDSRPRPLATPESDDSESERVAEDRSLGRRILASGIDLLVCSLFCYALHRSLERLGWIAALLPDPKDGLRAELIALLTVSLPVWSYFLLGEYGRASGTLGKTLLGLRVRTLAGGRMTFGQALLRVAVKLLPFEITQYAFLVPTPLSFDPNGTLVRPLFMLSTFLVGSWLVTLLIHPRQYSVHDLVAKTQVMRADALGIEPTSSST